MRQEGTRLVATQRWLAAHAAIGLDQLHRQLGLAVHPSAPIASTFVAAPVADAPMAPGMTRSDAITTSIPDGSGRLSHRREDPLVEQRVPAGLSGSAQLRLREGEGRIGLAEVLASHRWHTLGPTTTPMAAPPGPAGCQPGCLRWGSQRGFADMSNGVGSIGLSALPRVGADPNLGFSGRCPGASSDSGGSR